MAALVFMPYCPGSIGEQVVQIPFFSLLRALHADSPIVAVAPARSGALIRELGLVDRLHEYPVRGGGLQLLGLAGGLRSPRYDAVFQLRRKSLRASVMARMLAGPRAVGFEHGVNRLLQGRRVPYQVDRYIGENYVSLLGKTMQDYAGRETPQSDGHIVIIPGGRTRIKRYRLSHYTTIAAELASRAPVRFLLGPDRHAERSEIERNSPESAIDFGRPIAEVERIVARAALVIANDCGPAHFAHIRDVPRVSLFDRSVNAAHWFFAGRRGRLLRSPAPGEIDRIAPDEVLAAALELLESTAALQNASPRAR